MEYQKDGGPSTVVLNFIQNNRRVLFGILATIVLALIGLAVYGLISFNFAMDVAAQVDRAVIRFEALRGLEENDPIRSERKEEVYNMLRPHTENKTDPYAGAKALWVMAELEGLKENQESQIQYLSRLLEWYPNSHRNIEATFALANLYLEAERDAEALSLFEGLKNNPQIPAFYREEILFILGSITEKTDTTKAIEFYKELTDLFPLSDWTKLARSRILYLGRQYGSQ